MEESSNEDQKPDTDQSFTLAVSTESMTNAARAARNCLPDHCGMILLVAPYSDGAEDVNAQYVSNCNREDAVAILKTLLFRWGVNEEWMQHIR